ncbi:MAG: DNA-binding protein [Bacteroidetes bacterium]|nr:MAG: DNA-binding protein [Bacteroidota bacterium]
MDVITIESEAYRELLEIIKDGFTEIKRKQKSQPLSERWLEGKEVMDLLHCSPRHLQTLRHSGELPASKVRGKLYYRAVDVEALLRKHYNGKLEE